jgi:putative transcriptional regulator
VVDFSKWNHVPNLESVREYQYRMAGEKINRLKIVLTELGITQKSLAEKLSVTEHTISRICTNDTQPSLKLLKEIAIILDVDIRDLLFPTPSKRK